MTSDVSLPETAQAAEFFLSDGVVVTGNTTGQPVDKEEVKAVQGSVNIPVVIGSGVSAENVNDYLMADAIVIGSYFKCAGIWRNEISEARVAKLMEVSHSNQ